MTEHFVTLFDIGFLPMGMALHGSLREHCPDSHLWVVCMDEAVEVALRRMKLQDISVIPLAEIEDERLLKIKPGRSRREYCWTITSHSLSAVFNRSSAVERVTYVDADLFFFSSPTRLFDQMQPGKGLLVTEHEYPPERAGWVNTQGRFCVQFLTVVRDPRALSALAWWQERVREWCFDRPEPGRFGDQLYLNQWPELFAEILAVVEPRGYCLGPWNADYWYPRTPDPVFFHFHQLRFMGGGRIQLADFYRLGRARQELYPHYLRALASSIRRLDELQISGPWAAPRQSISLREYLSRLKRRLAGWRYEAQLP